MNEPEKNRGDSDVNNDGLAAIVAPGDVANIPMISGAGRERARKGIAEQIGGAALLTQLIDANLASDAIMITPHLLPVRHAVWWGCVCAWHGYGGKPKEAADDALRAAVEWVCDPLPTRVSAANMRSREAGLETPAGCVARAAVFAGSYDGIGTAFKTMSAVGAAKLLSGAAQYALRDAPWNGVAASTEQFVRFALDIGAGAVPWEVPDNR